jgi:hypothetical protein
MVNRKRITGACIGKWGFIVVTGGVIKHHKNSITIIPAKPAEMPLLDGADSAGTTHV